MMQEDLYFIDNDSLSKLTFDELNSDTVQKCSRIIDEVNYEARFNPHRKSIKNLIDSPSARVLTMLKEVLQQEAVQALIDLYGNEGNGDVLLIAAALVAKEDASQELFGKRTVIVTDDKGLVTVAAVNSIDTLSTVQFKDLLARPE